MIEKEKVFNQEFFTKTCDNCMYHTRFPIILGYCKAKMELASIAAISCGVNRQFWKPSKRAFKEYKKLKKEFPEYFV